MSTKNYGDKPRSVDRKTKEAKLRNLYRESAKSVKPAPKSGTVRSGAGTKKKKR